MVMVGSAGMTVLWGAQCGGFSFLHWVKTEILEHSLGGGASGSDLALGKKLGFP